MCARDMELARAAVSVAKSFGVVFMGLAGTCHQQAAEELGVPFIAGMCCTPASGGADCNVSAACWLAEWFADLDYDENGRLLITK